MNARVPVNEHFRLSVSYGDGLWYVGSAAEDSYECAIQAGALGFEYWSLVEIKKWRNNVRPDTSLDEIPMLYDLAQSLVYSGRLWVYCEGNIGEPPSWRFRHHTAAGHDEEMKLKHSDYIYDGKDGITAWCFLPADGRPIRTGGAFNSTEGIVDPLLTR